MVFYNGIQSFDDYLILSKTLYEKEPIFATAAKFVNNFYVKIEPYLENDVKIFFKNKEENIDKQDFIDEFCNSLIIEQAKFDLEKRFGNIRDMIVEQAFYPLEKK
jgi:His-Xaa-Ser system protein HxsD